jgi:hypothetical protein
MVIKWEKNETAKEQFRKFSLEYLTRAEKIKEICAHHSRGGGGDVPRVGMAGTGGSGEGGGRGGEGEASSQSMRSTVMADQSAGAVGEVLDLFALLVQKYECCTNAVAVGEVLDVFALLVQKYQC